MPRGRPTQAAITARFEAAEKEAEARAQEDVQRALKAAFLARKVAKSEIARNVR